MRRFSSWEVAELIFKINPSTLRGKLAADPSLPAGEVEPDGRQIMTTNGGSYHDELVRTKDGWRIKNRVCDQTILTGLPEDYVIPS